MGERMVHIFFPSLFSNFWLQGYATITLIFTCYLHLDIPPQKNYMTYMHAFKFRKHIHKSAAGERKKERKQTKMWQRDEEKKRKSPYFSSLRRVAEKTTGDFFPMVFPLYYSIYGCECNFLPKNRPRSSVVHPSKKGKKLQWKEHIFLQSSRSTTHAREYNGIATSEILCNIIYLRPAYTELRW